MTVLIPLLSSSLSEKKMTFAIFSNFELKIYIYKFLIYTYIPYKNKFYYYFRTLRKYITKIVKQKFL